MLFKLTVSNIKKSLRDYAVYFFTLIIGVSIFYVFNAIESQTAYLNVSRDTREVIKIINKILSGVSVFVAVVLGLLIVYASRFLMKRRNREFALYLTLGMSKSRISLLLLTETVMIGAGSLFAGLLIGAGISQVSSALVASLFEADMSEYHFNISQSAIVKTLIYFGIMYIVVMLFNTVMIGRRRLIDLMNAGKRSEKLKVKNPVVCVIMFMIAAAALGFAYYMVGWRTTELEESTFFIYIAIGCVSTFLIFRSVSGLMLRVFMSAKGIYYKGLGAFTFRQLSSKVNTMVFSMTLICLMLFVTICALCSAFTIRNSLNRVLNECCPADYQAVMSMYYNGEEYMVENYIPLDDEKIYEQAGIDPEDYFEEYALTRAVYDESLNYEGFYGEYLDELLALDDDDSDGGLYLQEEPLISITDYNKLMEIYGREKETLGENEYFELCNVKKSETARNYMLKKGKEITAFGVTLKPKYDECINGVMELFDSYNNVGVTVVPDSVAAKAEAGVYYLTGNFNTDDKEKIDSYLEKLSSEAPNPVLSALSKEYEKHDEGNIGFTFYVLTKKQLAETNIGIKALVTFLGLYVGVVFLITSGAVLALRSLSDASDSIGRYEMLRKIGADERDIDHSLFLQTVMFFALPLLLAIFHSMFGMKFAYFFLGMYGVTAIIPSILMTGGIILLIFGGYFIITYICSRLMIKAENR